MSRMAIARKTFIDADGNKVTSPFDATALKFEFFDPAYTKADGEDNSKVPVVESRIHVLADLIESAPDDVDVLNGLAMWGLNHKGGDAYAGAAKSASTAWELHDAVIAALANGEWSEGRESGTASSQSMIVEAIEAVLVAEGITVTDTIRNNAREQTKTPEQRKSALARPDINAQYLRISAERKAEQARLAATKAADAQKVEGHQSLADMLGLVAE